MKVDFKEVFSQSFDVLKDNIVPFLIVAAVPMIMGLLTFFGVLGSAGVGSLGGGVLITVVSAIITAVFSVAMINMSIKGLNGETLTVDSAIPTSSQFIMALVLSIMVALLIMLGMLLLVIPGLILMFLLQYSIIFLLDKNEGLVDAMKSSINLAKNNIGETIILLIAVYVIGMVQAMIPFSDLVLMPFAMLLTVAVYNALQTEGISTKVVTTIEDNIEEGVK